MKNRVVFLFLSVLLASLPFSPNAFAQQQTVVRIVPRPPKVIRVGDRLPVDIVIEGGQNVAGYQVALEFDATLLKYDGVAYGSYLQGNTFWGKPRLVSGRMVRFAATSGLRESNGNGVLATLTFKIRKVETSRLTLLPSTVDLNGRVTFSGTTLSNKEGTRTFPGLEGADTFEQPGSDLVVEAIKATRALTLEDKKRGATPTTLPSKRYAYPKEVFPLHITLRNQGTQTSAKAKLIVYISTDKHISEDDTAVKSVDIVPLTKQRTVTLPLDISAPETAGIYYYGACIVDSESQIKTCSTQTAVITVPEDLEVPSNLISDVAFTQNATYFIVNAQFPKLLIENQVGVTYGSCVITLDLPGVPDEPLQTWNSEHPWLAGDPLYFKGPLLSPRQRIDALAGKYDLDATEVAIGGIGVGVGIGVGGTVGVKVAKKVLPFIPLGKAANVALRIGSKFKVWIPAIPTLSAGTVDKGLVAAGKFVISKVIGMAGDFVTEELATGVGYLIAEGVQWVFTEENEKEPPIEEELLASTADPILVLVPISEGNTPPPGESRFFFRIPGAVTDIGIKIEQVYFRKNDEGENEAFTAVYEAPWNLEDAFAAPGLHPMSLADYPPFQQLLPEIQEYLRRDFGAFTSAETRQVPETSALLPNYPNPFNPETWIPYQLSEPAHVTLTIYDIHGRAVRTLDLGHQRAGVYRSRGRAAHWDGRNTQGESVASGLYFYTLKAGKFTATRKMLIRK